MTARTDIHRPAVFNPADYEAIDYLDNQRPQWVEPAFPPSMPLDIRRDITRSLYERYQEYVVTWEQRILEHFPDWQTGGDDHSSIFQCNHCGTPIRWVVVVRHAPSGKNLAIGEQCADNRLGLTRDQFAAKFIKDKAARDAAALERERIRTEFQAANPDVVAFLAGVSTEWDSKDPEFLQSVKQQLDKKGELSEGQVAAVQKFIASRQAKEEKRQAETALLADVAPITEGRRQITGEIVSTKFQDSDFGDTLKMLVREDDGNKVWGTVPQNLQDMTRGTHWFDEKGMSQFTPAVVGELKGHRVTFKATITASKDDPHFGFFKRPTGAELVTEGEGR